MYFVVNRGRLWRWWGHHAVWEWGWAGECKCAIVEYSIEIMIMPLMEVFLFFVDNTDEPFVLFFSNSLPANCPGRLHWRSCSLRKRHTTQCYSRAPRPSRNEWRESCKYTRKFPRSLLFVCSSLLYTKQAYVFHGWRYNLSWTGAHPAWECRHDHFLEQELSLILYCYLLLLICTGFCLFAILLQISPSLEAC